MGRCETRWHRSTFVGSSGCSDHQPPGPLKKLKFTSIPNAPARCPAVQRAVAQILCIAYQKKIEEEAPDQGPTPIIFMGGPDNGPHDSCVDVLDNTIMFYGVVDETKPCPRAPLVCIL